MAKTRHFHISRIQTLRRTICHMGLGACCTTPLFKRQQRLDRLWTALPASLHSASSATAPHLRLTCPARWRRNPEIAWNAARPTGPSFTLHNRLRIAGDRPARYYSLLPESRLHSQRGPSLKGIKNARQENRYGQPAPQGDFLRPHHPQSFQI